MPGYVQVASSIKAGESKYLKITAFAPPTSSFPYPLSSLFSWSHIATMKSLSLSALALFTASASARSKSEMFGWQSMWHVPSGRCEEGETMGNSTFSQLIDHEQPELGTFEQFYYYDTTHWKGPGMTSPFPSGKWQVV